MRLYDERALGGTEGVTGPAESVVEFHGRLARGETAGLGDVFSFDSAYEYWRDIAVSFGARTPDKKSFAEMIETFFASALVRGEVGSYDIVAPRERRMGRVASVAFQRRGRPAQRAAASLVLEEGRWKVRTFPGVFPGELLRELKSKRMGCERFGP